MEDWDADLSPSNFATTHFPAERRGLSPWNFQGAPKERRRGRAEKRLSKRVFLESPFLLCPLKVISLNTWKVLKTLREQRRNGLSKSTLLNNRFSARPLRRTFSASWYFATTHLTAFMLTFSLSVTLRPMKWRTLSQRPKNIRAVGVANLNGDGLPSPCAWPAPDRNPRSLSHRSKQAKIDQPLVPAQNQKRAEYSFGEYGFRHRTQWVFRGSLSFGERAQRVPFSLYLCVMRAYRVSRTTHRVCRRTQWILSLSLSLNSFPPVPYKLKPKTKTTSSRNWSHFVLGTRQNKGNWSQQPKPWAIRRVKKGHFPHYKQGALVKAAAG